MFPNGFQILSKTKVEAVVFISLMVYMVFMVYMIYIVYMVYRESVFLILYIVQEKLVFQAAMAAPPGSKPDQHANQQVES